MFGKNGLRLCKRLSLGLQQSHIDDIEMTFLFFLALGKTPPGGAKMRDRSHIDNTLSLTMADPAKRFSGWTHILHWSPSNPSLK